MHRRYTLLWVCPVFTSLTPLQATSLSRPAVLSNLDLIKQLPPLQRHVILYIATHAALFCTKRSLSCAVFGAEVGSGTEARWCCMQGDVAHLYLPLRWHLGGRGSASTPLGRAHRPVTRGPGLWRCHGFSPHSLWFMQPACFRVVSALRTMWRLA